MKDESKTKKQLIDELTSLRRQVSKLEESGNERARMQAELERIRERFFLLSLAANDAVHDWDLVRDELWCNEVMQKLFGLEETVGDPWGWWMHVMHPDDRGRMVTAVERLLKSNLEFGSNEYRVQLFDGKYMYIYHRIYVIRDHEGSPVRLMGVATDITKRKQTQNALQKSEELYRILTEKSFAGVYVVQDGNFCFFNSNSISYTGYTSEELIGKESMSLVHPEDREQLKNNAIGMLQGECTLPYEFRVVTKKGKIIWFMETVTSILWNGRRAVLGNCMDLTERKRMEEEIRSVSMMDPLTGLHNRGGFLTLSEQQLKASVRHHRDMLLFFADIDGMKWINDTAGHEEGDRALIEVAGILKETFRASDIIARIGGDEFAILAMDTTEISPEGITARLQTQIDAHNKDRNRLYEISISIGAAYYYHETPCSLDELIVRADRMMYAQKRSKNYCRPH